MPFSSIVTLSTSLIAAPAAPPDTVRITAIVAPEVPAGVTALATSYSSLSEMEDDDWTTGDVAYDAMSAIMTQTPVETQVSGVIVIKRGTAVANVWTHDQLSTTDGEHTLSIDGVLAATFTASTSTAADISAGLIAAFNAGDFAATHTAAVVDTDTLSITGAVAGVPFILTAAAPGGDAPTVTQTVESVGVYEDLDAAFALLPFWRVYVPGMVDAEIREALRWVQADTVSRRNFLVYDEAGVGVYDATDTDSLAYEFKVAGHTRVNGLCHPNATEYAQGMAIGRVGGGFPGRRAQHYIALSGSVETTVSANRTSGQVSTMEDRAVSWTERLFGPTSDLLLLAPAPNIPSGHYIYQRHAEDYWWYTMRAAIDGYLKRDEGVDLDAAGLQDLADFVAQQMLPLVTNNVIADDFTVTFTPLADIPAGELAIGDYKTSGKILASATITPKLRKLTVSAEFSLV